MRAAVLPQPELELELQPRNVALWIYVAHPCSSVLVHLSTPPAICQSTSHTPQDSLNIGDIAPAWQCRPQRHTGTVWNRSTRVWYLLRQADTMYCTKEEIVRQRNTYHVICQSCHACEPGTYRSALKTWRAVMWKSQHLSKCPTDILSTKSPWSCRNRQYLFAPVMLQVRNPVETAHTGLFFIYTPTVPLDSTHILCIRSLTLLVFPCVLRAWVRQMSPSQSSDCIQHQQQVCCHLRAIANRGWSAVLLT